MTDHTTVERLPEVVETYLAAHRSGDQSTALKTFTPDAVVVDEGRTHRGTQEIAGWMRAAASEYTYTTEFVSATTSGASSVDVLQHLAGDFPGGQADLHFRFTLDGALIARLVIEP
ncbi:nuclear transport factor 2 family protein [Mycolicibacterium sp. F2034L]|uniref:nuclear transport factor 2 family protein n=1 Tax=Mycolicibacterium sp. F2034L TaxID=2926422 RepID=UPI001FF34B68|nr:nuclear transport factor 2 family protein [Mycolicibacterium sp. F2034L]MCK0173810.1 nuclear transport factor 2 family protein [Mycolicibacterium sp. F2034L]